jgi:Na+/proline symporter
VIFPLFLIFLLVAMLWVCIIRSNRIARTPPGLGDQSERFCFSDFHGTEVPHLLKGFLIVAILSAAMSSVSSALTSLASVSTMDFVKHLLPEGTESVYVI